jgi:branched-chain amino acid transport system substrate-binding protein
VPATYAFQAYDAALLDRQRGSPGQGRPPQGCAARGDDEGRLQVAARRFKFNTNHYPIQDFYLVKVAKRPDGKYETEIVKKVFSNYGDPFAKDCPMK